MLAIPLVRPLFEGESTRVASDPFVQLFVMGTGDGHKDADGRLFHGGYWRDESDWPVAGVSASIFRAATSLDSM